VIRYHNKSTRKVSWCKFAWNYCGEVIQYIVETCAQELVCWEQGEKLPWRAVQDSHVCPSQARAGLRRLLSPCSAKS